MNTFSRLVLIGFCLLIWQPSLLAQTVIDSVRMDISVYYFQYRNGVNDSIYNCGAGLYATWPDDAAQVFGGPTSYNTYSRVATDGQYVPPGFGETLTNPTLNIYVPAGSFGHVPGIGGGKSGFDFDNCGDFLASAQNVASGAQVTLNGSPFRVTEWYATYEIPDGTPIAKFETMQMGAVDPPFVSNRSAVSFDGSFESDLSKEVNFDGDVPVATYEWTFGDGMFGAGAKTSHIYDEPGDYVVKLLVTDDDGDTTSVSKSVSVTSAILNYQISEDHDTVTLGDTISVNTVVRNIGVDVAKDVVIPRTYTFSYTPYPITENAETGGPILLSDSLKLDINPGDSVTVEQQYVVTKTARNMVDGVLRTVPVDWIPVMINISGEDLAGGPAEIQNACESIDCDNVIPIVLITDHLVNSTGDDSDDAPGDGACSTGSVIELDDGSDVAECTLRAAIEESNADVSVSTIEFNIEGDGPFTIALGSPLPAVVNGVDIDGTSQPGYDDRPVITIDGSGAGASDGLVLQGDGAVVTGLGVDGFTGNGIVVEASNVELTRLWIGELLGNGGNGILARGQFNNLTIGLEADDESGNAIANSGGHGIFLEGPDEGQSGKTAASGININAANNFIGLLAGADGAPPTAAGNVLSGILIENVSVSNFIKNIVGNNGHHGIEVMGTGASQNVMEENVIGAWIKQVGGVLQEAIPMGNTMNGVFIHSGANSTRLGATGGGRNTVVSNGEYGLRIFGGQNNSVFSSLFGVPADSTDQAPGSSTTKSIINFGNALGGICLDNAENNVIGQPGAANIISNNGSSEDDAGIILTGIESRSNQVASNYIGTNSIGQILGNIGSGILVLTGADRNTLGGETPEEGNRIGGNSGNGIYLRSEQTGNQLSTGAAGSIASINFGNVSNNFIGAFMMDDQPMLVPNSLNGICMLNAFETLVEDNSILGNGKNGIELLGPLSTENTFQGNSIGALADWGNLQLLDEIFTAGNQENGVHLHSEAFKNIFKSNGTRKHIGVGSGGYGFLLEDSHRNTMSGGSIGIIEDVESGALAKTGRSFAGASINLGNALGGLCLQRSANNQVGASEDPNVIANNGTDSTNAAIELLGPQTIQTSIVSNLIGTTILGAQDVGNTGPGILIDGARETTIGGMTEGSENVIAGNLGAGIKATAAGLTNVLGNFFGKLAEESFAEPIENLGPAVSFEGSDQINLTANSFITGDAPAIRVNESVGLSVTDNELVGDELIHVLQNSAATIFGNTIRGKETEATGDSKAVLVDGSTVSFGGLTRGNTLELNGADGVVFNDAIGSVTSSSISGANTAVSVQNAQVRIQAMNAEQNVTAITATENAKLDVEMTNITMDITDSVMGMYAENIANGSIRNTSVTTVLENEHARKTTSRSLDAGDAIYLVNSSLVINDNSILGSPGFGIRNATPSTIVDATGNWWGEADGPGGVGPGSGDEVSAGVDFSGWLESQNGLQITIEAADTLVVIPGDSVSVQAVLLNQANISDVVDIDVDVSQQSWLASSASFSIQTDDSPASFQFEVGIPVNAIGGSLESITLLGESQTTSGLVGQASVVLLVASAEASATAIVGAGETGTIVESDGPSGLAQVEIVGNLATTSATLHLFDNGSPMSTDFLDTRVLSPDSTVVRPVQLVSGASWSFRSDLQPSSATPSSSGKTSHNAQGAYTFDACFEAESHAGTLVNLDRSIVMFRPYSNQPWTAVSTSLRSIATLDYLCAENFDQPGDFTLATGVEATPSPPATIFPAQGLTGTATDIIFTWDASVGASGYEYEFSNDSVFFDSEVSQLTTAQFFNLSGLEVNTTYYWRVRAGSEVGLGPWGETQQFTTSPTGVEVQVEEPLPLEATLEANYPNPFNRSTTITYTLPRADVVKIEVFDLQGRRTHILVDDQLPAGKHQLTFHAGRIASGIYFYRMTTGEGALSRSMVVIK